MTDKQWYSVPEFAELIGWSRQYVYEMVKARVIPAARRGGAGHFFKIPRSEVMKWGLLGDEKNEVDLRIR